MNYNTNVFPSGEHRLVPGVHYLLWLGVLYGTLFFFLVRFGLLFTSLESQITTQESAKESLEVFRLLLEKERKLGQPEPDKIRDLKENCHYLSQLHSHYRFSVGAVLARISEQLSLQKSLVRLSRISYKIPGRDRGLGEWILNGRANSVDAILEFKKNLDTDIKFTGKHKLQNFLVVPDSAGAKSYNFVMKFEVIP